MQLRSLAALALAFATAPAAAASSQNATGSASTCAAPTGAPSTGALLRPQASPAAVLKILVLDDADKDLAVTAATHLGLATVAGYANFNSLLASQTWDVVVVDSTSSLGIVWGPLTDYVNTGGRAVVSYWDWDFQPLLSSAFDVQPVGSTLFLHESVLLDSGTSPAFLGVSMPCSDWNNFSGDDGDRFLPLSGAQGLAHVGDPNQPVIVRGNAGRTIAAPLLNEAGNGWLADGSAIQLWKNLIQMAVYAEGPDVLVYDQESQHHLAQLAAFESYPGTTHVANKATFDAMLQSQAWDAVLVDCPDTPPTGGWGALIDHVDDGGRVALSFWDWDDDAGIGDPKLPAAFDVAVAGDLSWDGLTLFDAGLTGAFLDVTMPNSSWGHTFNDDGDRFTPVAPARGLGHVGNPNQPVLVWGNAGRTVAAPVFDEAGPEWLFDGSAVQLWSNLLEMILSLEPHCAARNGILGLNPSDYDCVAPPVIGGTWVVNVDTTPLLGTATLATIVGVGLGGPAQGLPVLGFELLIWPPFLQTAGFGTHAIPVSADPLLAGVTVASQAVRVELGASGALHVVLTNAQDVTFGK